MSGTRGIVKRLDELQSQQDVLKSEWSAISDLRSEFVSYLILFNSCKVGRLPELEARLAHEVRL